MLKKYLYNLTSIIPKNSRNNKNHTKNSHTCYVNFPENFKTLNSQVYYLIYIENKGHGFFSNFYHVLFHISIADFYNWIPVVDMMNYKTLYNEDKIFLSTYNSWEYYFRQKKKLSNINFKKDRVIYSNGKFPTEIFKKYYYGNEIYFYNLFKKYILIKKNIRKKVSNFRKKNFGRSKIIGVHWRGTDITNAKYKKNGSIFYKYRKKFTIDNFRVKIDPLLKKYKNAKIFISTDEENHINQFKNLYGERVIFTDSYRSKSKKPIHLGTNNSRKNHKYKLGLEVLIDSLLLSESDILICRKSNVTNAALLFNNNKKRKLIELAY